MPTRVSHVSESWTYVLRCDREQPLDRQSRFVLRPLTQAERIQSVDALVHTKDVPDGARLTLHRTGQVARELALGHIVSTENFPVGEPVPWPAEGSLEQRSKYLEMLADDNVHELGNEVWAHSAIDTATSNVLKNSSTPEAMSRSGDSSVATQISTPAPAASETLT